jgi:hypothetical protein
MRDFLLPWEAECATPDPERAGLDFLQAADSTAADPGA